MPDDLVEMARLAQHDERMATGALYGDLADRIEELEAKLAQQDDLVQAAGAAALTEAAEDVRQWGSLYSGSEDVTDEIAHDILALITPDAQAALDRVVAEERERCAKIAWSHVDDETSGDPDFDAGWEAAACAITDAIRKGGE